MPIMMRLDFKPEVAKKAIEIGLIYVDADGLLVWTDSQTLLAYLCGRMWCGDKAVKNRSVGKSLWAQGKGKFPYNGIKRVFRNASGLTDLRRKRRNLTPPEGFYVVDSLFVTR